MSAGTIPLPGTADDVRDHAATVLDRAAALGLSLGRVSVSALLRDHGDALLDGVPGEQRDAVTAAVRTLHRAYQITPTDDAMAALLRTGLSSAYDVTAMPLRTFLARHGDRLRLPRRGHRRLRQGPAGQQRHAGRGVGGPAARRGAAGVRPVRRRRRPASTAGTPWSRRSRPWSSCSAARTTAPATTAARC